ncbi:MAG: hypothetical protein WCT37_03505 [Patescibacteria group bacterium]|jgi:amino acid transporter
MKKTFILLSLLALFLPLLSAAPALAINDDNSEFIGSKIWGAMKVGGLTEIGDKAYGAENKEQRDLPFIITSLIRTFLTLLGTIFLVLVIYAGFRWMTAAGNEEQVTEAKDLMRNAVIGLGIILLAYAITTFVFMAISGASLPSSEVAG